jgi:alanyl-tRNA synthetase
MLGRGELLFDTIVQELETGSTADEKVRKMSGTDVWRLYDTFGFPIDLTRLMAKERGHALDEDAVLLEESRARKLRKERSAIKGSAAIDSKAFEAISLQPFDDTNFSFKYGMWNAYAR